MADVGDTKGSYTSLVAANNATASLSAQEPGNETPVKVIGKGLPKQVGAASAIHVHAAHYRLVLHAR